MSVIRVAVWDDAIVSDLHKNWSSEDVAVEVVVLSAEHAERAVLREEVDVALLPSTQALSRVESLDILAESAISTWRNSGVLVNRPVQEPPARLLISESARDSVFDLAAAVILKEHYHYSVERETDPSRVVPADESRSGVDGQNYSVLPASTPFDLASHLDISQEWYELVNYPMVWGLFVAAKHSATDEMIKGVRQWLAVLYSDAIDEFITDEGDMSERIRPRLDDLAIASLTELCDYMFYCGATPEVPVFKPVEIVVESL
jgi:chorismate dehydratase